MVLPAAGYFTDPARTNGEAKTAQDDVLEVVRTLETSTGDVSGPASATANAIVLFDGTTGKLVKDSTYTITAAGAAILDDADAEAQKATLGLANVAYKNISQDYTAPQRPAATQTATTGGTVTIDLTTYQNFNLTLSSNLTLANPTLTAVVGQRGRIDIIPGAYSISGMGTQWKRIGGTGSPSTITGRGRIDYDVIATDRIEYAYNDVEA